MRYDVIIIKDRMIDRLEKRAQEAGRDGYKPSGPVTMTEDEGTITTPCYLLTMWREK